MAFRNELETNGQNTNIREIDDRLNNRKSLEEEFERKMSNFKWQLVKAGLKLESDEAKKYIEKEIKYQRTLQQKEQKENKKAVDKQLVEENKQRLKFLIEEYKEKDRLNAEEQEHLKSYKKELHKLEYQQAKEQFKENIKNTLSVNNLVTKGFASAGQALNQVMSSYAKYQSTMNVRLQGTNQTFQTLQRSLLNNVGITPYIKTQTMLDNLQNFVTSGVAFNLEQRAFLATISDKVAATFNAFDSNLARIIRLQQEDSTAGRLGMESMMNQFLNNMFSTTEYLTDSFDSVTQALVEATSTMSTQMGVEFEYVVQKWLGSLYGVGLSSATVSGIAQAIGYLATGDISSLESSSMQQLIVMAASRAGLDYGKLISGGISTSQANALLGSMVGYMQEIGSQKSNVARTSMAQMFGLSVSDLVAASNLRTEDIQNISKSLLSYSGAIQNLNTQMGLVSSRVSMAEMLENLTDNAKFSLFSTIAASPALYAMWQVADMVSSLSGGTGIPSYLGTSLGMSVDQMMKLGIIGVGSFGMIGDIISGISNTLNFANALSALGIGTNIVGTTRGSGISTTSSGLSTSTSGFIGQSESGSYYDQTMSKMNQELDVMKSEQGEQPIDTIDSNVAAILSLLQEGIKVTVADYGLTGNI